MINPLLSGLFLLGLVISIVLIAKGHRIAGSILTFLFLMLNLAVIIPGTKTSKTRAQMNECQRNQQQIAGAMKSWSLEKGKSAGDKVEVTEVALFLKGGVLPVCPAGGSYTITTVGAKPTCSLTQLSH